MADTSGMSNEEQNTNEAMSEGENTASTSAGDYQQYTDAAGYAANSYWHGDRHDRHGEWNGERHGGRYSNTVIEEVNDLPAYYNAALYAHLSEEEKLSVLQHQMRQQQQQQEPETAYGTQSGITSNPEARGYYDPRSFGQYLLQQFHPGRFYEATPGCCTPPPTWYADGRTFGRETAQQGCQPPPQGPFCRQDYNEQVDRGQPSQETGRTFPQNVQENLRGNGVQPPPPQFSTAVGSPGSPPPWPEDNHPHEDAEESSREANLHARATSQEDTQRASQSGATAFTTFSSLPAQMAAKLIQYFARLQLSHAGKSEEEVCAMTREEMLRAVHLCKPEINMVPFKLAFGMATTIIDPVAPMNGAVSGTGNGRSDGVDGRPASASRHESPPPLIPLHTDSPEVRERVEPDSFAAARDIPAHLLPAMGPGVASTSRAMDERFCQPVDLTPERADNKTRGVGGLFGRCGLECSRDILDNSPECRDYTNCAEPTTRDEDQQTAGVPRVPGVPSSGSSVPPGHEDEPPKPSVLQGVDESPMEAVTARSATPKEHLSEPLPLGSPPGCSRASTPFSQQGLTPMASPEEVQDGSPKTGNELSPLSSLFTSSNPRVEVQKVYPEGLPVTSSFGSSGWSSASPPIAVQEEPRPIEPPPNHRTQDMALDVKTTSVAQPSRYATRSSSSAQTRETNESPGAAEQDSGPTFPKTSPSARPIREEYMNTRAVAPTAMANSSTDVRLGAHAEGGAADAARFPVGSSSPTRFPTRGDPRTAWARGQPRLGLPPVEPGEHRAAGGPVRATRWAAAHAGALASSSGGRPADPRTGVSARPTDPRLRTRRAALHGAEAGRFGDCADNGHGAQEHHAAGADGRAGVAGPPRRRTSLCVPPSRRRDGTRRSRSADAASARCFAAWAAANGARPRTRARARSVAAAFAASAAAALARLRPLPHRRAAAARAARLSCLPAPSAAGLFNP